MERTAHAFRTFRAGTVSTLRLAIGPVETLRQPERETVRILSLGPLDDDGRLRYVVDVYGLPIEIWHDQEGTRINIERSIDNDAFTPTQAQQVADVMAEAVRILDGHEAS